MIVSPGHRSGVFAEGAYRKLYANTWNKRTGKCMCETNAHGSALVVSVYIHRECDIKKIIVSRHAVENFVTCLGNLGRLLQLQCVKTHVCNTCISLFERLFEVKRIPVFRRMHFQILAVRHRTVVRTKKNIASKEYFQSEEA